MKDENISNVKVKENANPNKAPHAKFCRNYTKLLNCDNNGSLSKKKKPHTVFVPTRLNLNSKQKISIKVGFF